MYRVYVGNLDSRVTADTLHSLFDEHKLRPTNVLVRKGYAFVDCPDQYTVDKAIDHLHGKTKQCMQLECEYFLAWKSRWN